MRATWMRGCKRSDSNCRPLGRCPLRLPSPRTCPPCSQYISDETHAEDTPWLKPGSRMQVQRVAQAASLAPKQRIRLQLDIRSTPVEEGLGVREQMLVPV